MTRATLADVASAAGVSVPTVLEGAEREEARVGRHPRARSWKRSGPPGYEAAPPAEQTPRVGLVDLLIDGTRLAVGGGPRQRARSRRRRAGGSRSS